MTVLTRVMWTLVRFLIVVSKVGTCNQQLNTRIALEVANKLTIMIWSSNLLQNVEVLDVTRSLKIDNQVTP